MSDSPVTPRRDCPSFRPGHQTHWIQARLSWKQYAEDRWPVDEVVVEDSGLLVLTMADGTVEHRWTHDPRFVRARLADPERRRRPVQLAEPALLKVGGSLVSVCTLDAIVRCPTDADVGALSLEERLEQLGGFSMPGRDAPTHEEGEPGS